jgi:hypothetical protein
MAYDSDREKFILFGGETIVGGSPVFLNDTWEYDLDDNNWTEIFPTPVPPESAGTIVYDSNEKDILLFTGINVLTGNYNETWELSIGAPVATNIMLNTTAGVVSKSYNLLNDMLTFTPSGFVMSIMNINSKTGKIEEWIYDTGNCSNYVMVVDDTIAPFNFTSDSGGNVSFKYKVNNTGLAIKDILLYQNTFEGQYSWYKNSVCRGNYMP